MTVSLVHPNRPLGASKPVTIDQLTGHSCRWPLSSGSPWKFCGLPKARGAYCEVHGSLAYRRPADKEKT